MSSPIPAALLERIFASEAPKALPLEGATILRSERGILEYRWDSPCDVVGSLWVTILTNEIMLGTRTYHQHFDRHCYEVRTESTYEKDVPKRIVQAAIAEVKAILEGERVFVKVFDPHGAEHSSSGMSPLALWNDLQGRASWTAFHGDGWTARGWNWFGAVIDPNRSFG